MIAMTRPVKPRRARADLSSDEALAARVADPVPIGVARRAHGVAGEMLVQALGETLASVREGEGIIAHFRRPSCPPRRLTIRRIRPTHGGGHLVEFGEIRSREEAKALCGAEICVPRSRLATLEPDEFYRTDLLGLAVVTESGEPLGIVHAFLDLPQHDILVVRDGSRETLLPMVEGSIHAVELGARRIVASRFLDELAATRQSTKRARTGEPSARTTTREGA